MRGFAVLLFASVAAISFTTTAPKAQAQVAVEVGAAPDCPYGYYDVAPYNCAPYGYYGPEWFNGGVFIGAGPWFHGPENFHGHVNNHFHPNMGIKVRCRRKARSPTLRSISTPRILKATKCATGTDM